MSNLTLSIFLYLSLSLLQPTTTSTEGSAIQKKDEDDVGNPFNIQHLMHVDKNNLDQFIALMNTQYSQQQQQSHSTDNNSNDKQQQPPKRRGTMMQKMKASMRRDTAKTQAKPTPVISGPSDMRKTDGADLLTPSGKKETFCLEVFFPSFWVNNGYFQDLLISYFILPSS